MSEFGLAPLGYATVEAWARLMDVEVEPHEVEALMVLDAVMRNPEAPKEEPEPVETPVWRDRPPGVEPVLIPSD